MNVAPLANRSTSVLPAAAARSFPALRRVMVDINSPSADLFSGRFRRQNRNLYVRRKPLRTKTPLCGFLIVGFFGFENVGHELLRIAVDDGKPCALHLHHDAVALLEDVIRGMEIDDERRYLSGNDGLGLFERFAEAPANRSKSPSPSFQIGRAHV